MAFCSNCGAQLSDGMNNCPNCGAPVNNGNQFNQNNQNNQNNQFNSNSQNKGGGLNIDTPDHTNEYDPADIQQNKVLALFSYIGILFLVPLLGAPNSRYCRFHANQGLILFIIEAVYGVVSGVIQNFFWWFDNGFVHNILSLVFGLLWLPITLFAILGVVYAVTGKAQELPIIGKIKLIK